jgi:hypothetical protein
MLPNLGFQIGTAPGLHQGLFKTKVRGCIFLELPEELMIKPGAGVTGSLLVALVQVLKEYLVLPVDLFDADGKAVFPGKKIHGFSFWFS